MAPAPSLVSSTGVLTYEQVAAELGCGVMHVKRLVGRGQLVANRLQSFDRGPIENAKKYLTSEWRILATEVARYVADGAPDFTAPEYNDINGGWFLDLESNFRSTAQAELAAACESQELPDAAVIARAKAAFSQMITVKLRFDSDVQSANKSARRSKFSEDLRNVLRKCQTWARVLAVSKMRDLARKALPNAIANVIEADGGLFIRGSSTGAALSPLDVFYNPENYDAVCDLAFEELQRFNLTGYSRMVANPDGGHVTVMYVLPYSGATFDKQLVCDLAF